MASQRAIVTHLSALQEIASMDVLCSDKASSQAATTHNQTRPPLQ